MVCPVVCCRETLHFMTFLEWFEPCFIILLLTQSLYIVGCRNPFCIVMMCRHRCTLWRCPPHLAYLPVQCWVSGFASQPRSRFLSFGPFSPFVKRFFHGCGLLFANTSCSLGFPAMSQAACPANSSTDTCYLLWHFLHLTFANSLVVSYFSIEPFSLIVWAFFCTFASERCMLNQFLRPVLD